MCWKQEPPDTPDAKPKKLPVNPKTGWLAKVDNSKTWGTFDQALARFKRSPELHGIGIVFVKAKPKVKDTPVDEVKDEPVNAFCGIDIDECIDAKAHKLEPWAEELVQRLNSYSEISPSETGIKIFTKANIGGRGSTPKFREHPYEVYDRGRFFTVTGERLASTPEGIEERQSVLDELLPPVRHEAANLTPVGIPIPAGVIFRDAIASKLTFQIKEASDGVTLFTYHGLRGFQGDLQPCLTQGSLHKDQLRNPAQSAFAEKGGYFWHTCFDSDCRAIGQPSGARGTEMMERGDSTSKTRLAVERIGLADILLSSNATATTADGAWPEPESLGDDLPPVPAFDLEMLPKSSRDFVSDIAERMQVPLDFPSAAAIVSLAGCVGRRARILPKVHDSGWKAIPNLWGATVAPPGFLKSPVLLAVTSPLAHIEEMWRAEHAGVLAEFEAGQKRRDLVDAEYDRKLKLAVRNDYPDPIKPDTTVLPPVKRRLLITDCTPEKLQEIMIDNPAGLMVLRDELSGLFAEMGKEGRESQRQFFLQCWNGEGGYSIDRINRGSLHVPNVCLSIFGNVQPSRLRTYLQETFDGGPGDDGFFQRFQILVWPDPPGPWKLVDRPPNNAVLARAEKVFSRLANLPTESISLRFTPDAQKFFFDWWGGLEGKVRGAIGLPAPLVGHLEKFRGLMPSLAGLFELADLVANDLTPRENEKINLDHTQQAARLCHYLEAHARRCYSSILSPDLHAARELAKHIERGALAETFSGREIYRHNWAGLDKPGLVASALTTLEESSWIRKIKTVVGPVGGRPSDRWELNPALRRPGK